jgi:hypothetical protein
LELLPSYIELGLFLTPEEAQEFEYNRLEVVNIPAVEPDASRWMSSA